MYRIIERGGNRIGPRRAFMFAKEFNLDINIPMKYGVDHSDPGLYHFISEYIKSGGAKDLVCISNYFSREKKNKLIDTITINDIYHNALKFYAMGFRENGEELYKLIKSIEESKNTVASSHEVSEIKDNKMKQLKK